MSDRARLQFLASTIVPGLAGRLVEKFGIGGSTAELFTEAVDALPSLLTEIQEKDAELERLRSWSEATAAKLQTVLEFVKRPPDHQHVADYYRWTGNAQSRQELAALLGITPPRNVFAAAVAVDPKDGAM